MQQKKSGDTKAHTEQFNQGDRVMSWNFADGPKWVPGEEKLRIVQVKWIMVESGVVMLITSQVQLKVSQVTRSICTMDPLVAPFGEQNAESTPMENWGPRITAGSH